MSGIGDLVAKLVIDNSGYMQPLLQAADAAVEWSTQSEGAIQQVELGWRSLVGQAAATAAGVVSAHAVMAGASATVSAATSAATVAKDAFLDPTNWQIAGSAVAAYATLTSGSLTQVAANLWNTGDAQVALFGTADVIKAEGFWAKAGNAVLAYGGLVSSVVGMVVPQWKLVTMTISASIMAYRIASSDMVQSAIQSTTEQLRLGESVGRVTGSVSRLGSTISSELIQPVSEMATGIGDAVSQWWNQDGVIKAVGDRLENWSKTAEKSIDSVQKSWAGYGAQLSTMLFITSSMGNVSEAQIQTFHEEGIALKQLAAETEDRIARLEASRSLYQELANIQMNASAAAEHAEELARIRQIKTIEGIDEEIRARRQLNDELIRKGIPNPVDIEKDVFGALYSQRAGIESGRIKPEEEKDKKPEKSPVDDLIRQTEQQIAVMKLGETEAALAAAAANGATEQQLQTLRSVLEQKQELKALDEAQREADRAYEQAQQKQQREAEQAAQSKQNAEKQALESLLKMQREMAILRGEATKTDLVIAELMDKGVSEQAAVAVGEAQAKLEAMKKEATDAEKRSKQKPGSNKAMLAGTSETASVILRGVSGPSTTKIQADQLNTQKQIVAAIKSQKANKSGQQILLAGNISGY